MCLNFKSLKVTQTELIKVQKRCICVSQSFIRLKVCKLCLQLYLETHSPLFSFCCILCCTLTVAYSYPCILCCSLKLHTLTSAYFAVHLLLHTLPTAYFDVHLYVLLHTLLKTCHCIQCVFFYTLTVAYTYCYKICGILNVAYALTAAYLPLHFNV